MSELLFQLLFLSSHSQWVRSLHTLNSCLVALPLKCLTWVKCFGNLPQASHNKLGEFWPISPDRDGVIESDFIGLLARTHFFSSAHKCSIGLRLGLCDGHANTLTLLSLSHFATTLEVCLGSLSIWKPHLRPSFNFLTDVLRCCFNIARSCSLLLMPSILWSAPVPPAAKHHFPSCLKAQSI